MQGGLQVGLVLLAATAMVAPGCFGDADTPNEPAEPLPTDPRADTGSGSTGGAEGTDEPGEGTGPDGNITGPEPTQLNRTWPSLDSASIRPGVVMTNDGRDCTSNFVFSDPFNTTLYLGFAAHCAAEAPTVGGTNGCSDTVTPVEPGAKVGIQGASQDGILVYSSWWTMQQRDEANQNACAFNDFALVEIHPDDHAKVHPAMLHYGGPTGMAESAQSLDRVITFGSSTARPGPQLLDQHEGYVVSSGDWTHEVATVTPGIPGDSGSGVLLGATGEALGIVVTVQYVGLTNGVTDLAVAMDYARETTGMEFYLATWDLLDDGILPEL